MKCGIALPNVQSSSDHIMLLCDIQLGGGTGHVGQAQPPASPIFQGQQKVGGRCSCCEFAVCGGRGPSSKRCRGV